MKRVVAYCVLFFLTTLTLIGFLFFSREYPMPPYERQENYPSDFRLRMNEIDCLKRGVNPFDVWSMKRELLPFIPYERDDMWTPEHCEIINSYSPWEYIMMMPFSFLPRKIAWRIFNYGQLLSFLLILSLAFYIGRTTFGDNMGGCICSIFSALIGAVSIIDFLCGNFGIIIAVSIFFMLIALNTKHYVLAGCFWSIAMIKPQISLLMAIPLLIKRRWLTCIVAASICLACSFISAYLCHTSIVDLLLQTVQGASPVFWGCGLLPYELYRAISPYIANDVLSLALILISAGLCLWLTYMLRCCEDWFVLSIPAFVCLLTCSHCRTFNYCALAFVLVVIAVYVYRSWHCSSVAIPIAMAIMIIRPCDIWSFIVVYAGGILSRIGIWPWGNIPTEINYSLMTWSSTILLILTILFVYQIRNIKLQIWPVRKLP